nr:hypothetical protein [uncultured Deefgea sp.]
MLGLGTLYIEIIGKDSLSLILLIFGLVFLSYGLGGAKWLGKIDSRFNSNPLEEYKKLMKNEAETQPKS